MDHSSYEKKPQFSIWHLSNNEERIQDIKNIFINSFKKLSYDGSDDVLKFETIDCYENLEQKMQNGSKPNIMITDVLVKHNNMVTERDFSKRYVNIVSAYSDVPIFVYDPSNNHKQIVKRIIKDRTNPDSDRYIDHSVEFEDVGDIKDLKEELGFLFPTMFYDFLVKNTPKNGNGASR